MKAAVIGAGYIAREHLKALREVPDAEVVGICDLSPVMAEATAEWFGIPGWYTSHAEMLAQTRPDVVHITTPPGSHVFLATDSIEAGAHVFVEKPLAPTGAELEALKTLATKHGRVMVEDQNYLFNDSVQEIVQMVESGRMGEVLHVDVRMFLDIHSKGGRYCDENAPHPSLRLPGGAIADFLTHLSYMVYAFVGKHLDVRSTWRKRAESVLPADEMRALVDCERGSAFMMYSSHGGPMGFWLTVQGTRARAFASLWEPHLAVEEIQTGPRPLMPVKNNLALARAYRARGLKGLWEKLAGRPPGYQGLGRLVGRFYESLRGEAPCPVPLEQIEAVHHLIEALTDDAKSF